MGSLSVQLNDLSVGSQTLSRQSFSESHQKTAEACVSKIISKYIPEGMAAKCQIILDAVKPSVVLNGRVIQLDESSEVKKLRRIAQFYQHMGHLAKPTVSEHTELREDASQKAIKAMNEASIPGNNGQILAGIRIADDSLSLFRNGLYALPVVKNNDAIANHLGYYASILWSFFSAREIQGGWQDFQQAKLIGDAEGKRRAEARLLAGGISLTGSFSYFAGRICDTVSAADVASFAFGGADLLFGVGSLVAAGSSLLGALRCHRFNQRLNEYLNHPGISEIEKIRGALHFLKDSVRVTGEEQMALITEIEQSHPDWSLEQKEKYFQMKLVDLTEKKVKYLKRRTSNKSLGLILEKTDRLLAELEDPSKSSKALTESMEMLLTIQKENKIKRALYLLGFVAAIIGFLALVVSTFFTGGALPFILYGISGTIYLGLSFYSLAMMRRKKPENQPVDTNPILALAPEPQPGGF